MSQNCSITSPKGFRAAGVSAGLKKTGAPDLALVVSDTPAVTAGVYTRNVVKGHSLVRTIEALQRTETVHGVLINSGNANACVGAIGQKDAEEAARAVSDLLHCHPDQVLTCSTGVIGQRLNMEAILSGIPVAFHSLSHEIAAGHLAMQAMMTTDLVPKESFARISIGDKTVSIAGMAKGSGMIHPNLGTMISIITTDAAISRDFLQQILSRVSAKTFNRVSVDGDTSVCDTLLILANGMSDSAEILPGSNEADLFEDALLLVCLDLARMMAKDGEGATKLVEVEVSGARTPEDAYRIVLSVCRSPLCKTAIFGEDANWGRILTAAGYSGASFHPEEVDILIGGLPVCKNGCALPFDEAAAKRILQKDEVLISIRLREGECFDRMWTCDFSYDYVKINGSYRS